MRRRGALPLAWLAVAAYAVAAGRYASREARMAVCAEVEVRMLDTTYALVTPRDVGRLFEREGTPLYGAPMGDIDKMELARAIAAGIPQARHAVAYRYGRRLRIDVEPRVPIARVAPRQGRGYYLDAAGEAFPLSESGSARVMVLSGEIFEQCPPGRAARLADLNGPVEPNAARLADLYELARLVAADDMLRPLVEQIHVEGGEYELYPKVGNHVVRLGTADGMRGKLFRLKTLYAKGLTNIGWRKYRAVDLRHPNQIICTK